MRTKTLRWFLLALILVIAVALPTAAQTKTLYWDRFDVDITVNQDGTFDVAEKQVIQFTSGTFTGGFRSIDNNLTEGITNVTVEDENGAYVQNSSQNPGTLQSLNRAVRRW